jgi:hypothetical protein
LIITYLIEPSFARSRARAPAARHDQLVTVGRGGQIARRGALVRLHFLADDRVPMVLDAVDLAAAAGVVPVVAGEVVLRAVAAGEQRGMADRRERGRVLAVGVVYTTPCSMR